MTKKFPAIRWFQLFLPLGLAVIGASPNYAQMAGSRAGDLQQSARSTTHLPSLPELTVEQAQGMIKIEGSAEVRIKPTEIRIVLAITSERDSAAACREEVQIKIQTLTSAWVEAGIKSEDIHEDFISIIPRYEYLIQSQDDIPRVAKETKTGYFMQSNLHVRVADETQAMQVLNLAFTNQITEIIAFDYWSAELEQTKKEARQRALAAAKEKSELLLALFPTPPQLINVVEATEVINPVNLYESFQNVAADDYQTGWNVRDIVRIRAFRPKNTYYKGLFPGTDAFSPQLPMEVELSVVSRIGLYYATSEISEEKKE